MMKFYTNVSRYGNMLLYRGFENGRKIQQKIKYAPTLYVSTNRPTSWKALDGTPVGEVKFDSMREANEWVSRNKHVAGREIFGNTRYISAFIKMSFLVILNLIVI